MSKVAALVGPTASGKTSISLDVAQQLGAEIVSLDSMQIYRGMDIGTDKLPFDQRRGIAHHMIDLFDPSRDVTVAEFQTRARAAITDINERGKLPLLVGGSGLYFRAVVDDLRFPPTQPEVRAELEQELDVLGSEVMHGRLQELDAEAAARIEATNGRRIVRALEVIAVTGRPFSEQKAWDAYESIYELAAAGISLPRDELHTRIELRVDSMLERGLIDEARAIEPAAGRTARQALGYRQILEPAEGSTAADLRAAIIRATKRFARRQESWFRGDPRIQFFEGNRPELAIELVAFFRRTLRLALER